MLKNQKPVAVVPIVAAKSKTLVKECIDCGRILT